MTNGSVAGSDLEFPFCIGTEALPSTPMQYASYKAIGSFISNIALRPQVKYGPVCTTPGSWEQPRYDCGTPRDFAWDH
jgi:hypothetical protein